MGGGADDPSFSSFASRWGIKGSSEVSEGLTSVYKFETRIGANATSTNAKGGIDDSQSTNQLYVGLSGGFGSITLGKQSSAAYNHSGAIRDISSWHSHGDVGSRISNALSYSYAAESFSMQVAAIMDGATDTDGAVDRVEFGMTVGLGDIGKVAIGYEKQEDSMMAGEAIEDATLWDGTAEVPMADFMLDADTGKVKVPEGVWRNADNEMVMGKVEVAHTNSVVEVYWDGSTPVMNPMSIGGKVYDAECYTGTPPTPKKGAAACTKTTHVWATVTPGTPANNDADPADPMVDSSIAQDSGGTTATVTPMDKTFGHKASHISASFGLAGITIGLGHTSTDSNDPTMGNKAKTNFLGASGGIGDSGLSWNAWGRNVEDHDGMETSPWTVGLAKSLGGGATTFIEHTNADDGEDGTTSIALRVDF